MSDLTTERLRRASLDGSPEALAAWLNAKLHEGRSELTRECKEAERLRFPCRSPGRTVDDCGQCKGTGRVPFTWEDRIALGAYCLDPAALLVRGLIEAGDGIALPAQSGSRVFYVPGESMFSKGLIVANELAQWLGGLKRGPSEAPVRAAIAAARCVLPTGDCGACEGCVTIEGVCYTRRAQCRVIEAAEAWIADPSEENQEAWYAASDGVPPWALFAANLMGAILSAASEAGEQPVRDAICVALVAWALGGE